MWLWKEGHPEWGVVNCVSVWGLDFGGPSWMGQSSSFTTPLCVGLCPSRLVPQTLRSMKTHSPCAVFWKPFWAKELFTLSFPSWIPPSSVCESSCPSLNGFKKSFNVLSGKFNVSLLQVGPTRWPGLDTVSLFWLCRPLGDPTVDPSITGRVVMSEPRAVKPLGLWGP